MKEYNKTETDSDTENKLVVTSGEREEGGAREEKGIKRHKLLLLNKLQRYIVQHKEYSQYFIITLNGIQCIKILNHYVVHQKIM